MESAISKEVYALIHSQITSVMDSIEQLNKIASMQNALLKQHQKELIEIRAVFAYQKALNDRLIERTSRL